MALDKDVIGWSQCNPRDKFNKMRGIKIAKGRALTGTNKKPVNIKIDKHSIDIISEYIIKMEKRAKKYFKDGYAGDKTGA